MLRLTAYISGTVQKVGYRAQVVLLANAFGLRGYVQNLPEGVVKVVAEGSEEDLERFLKALRIQDALIDVQNIEAQYGPASYEFIGFEKMVARGETDQRLDKAAGLLKELIVVNKDVVKELRATREGLQGEIKATREGLQQEIRATRKELKDEIKATRIGLQQEIKATREELREEIRATREGLGAEIKATRLELRDEIKATRQEVKCVCSEVRATGLMLAGRIEGAKEEIVELRSELRNDLKVKVSRMETDITQIKARVGL
ncbi:MAG: hypothetical protein HPY61_03530 [Methanotrichaceae archaeon]|nr:hypothetical protein [Methanotrichaceae archaeon]